MKILTLIISIIFLSTLDALACSCSSKTYSPSCELISKAEIVFIGEPINYSGGIYKFKVEKAYKGVIGANNEAQVYGLAGTSCEIEFSIGTKYLIFASKSSGTPNTFITNLCSGSRVASQSEIDYLDKFSKGETETVVFGQVLQWVTRHGLPDKDASNPVAGASLILENKTEKHTTTSDSEGRFSFTGISDGNYKLSARKVPLLPSPASYDISVIKGGCQLEFIQLKAMSAIEGTLLLRDGKPATNRRVELLRKNQSGEWYSTYYMWKQTDGKGKFNFDDLESGEYLLGYEIWGGYPSYKSPYPTHYFPNAANVNQAQTLTLSPNQIITGLTLKLPRQQTNRFIKIKVVYPDGSLPGNNLLQIFNHKSLIYKWDFKSAENGVFIFDGFKEREYIFSAKYWIDDLMDKGDWQKKRIAVSESVKVNPGEDSEITLILNKKILYKDFID